MILITGAAGFIGSAAAAILNRKGRQDLVLCDAFGDDDRWKNILGLRYRTFVHRDDLFYYLTTASEARSLTAILHFGACSDTTETDMDYLFQNNVNFSIQLCQWALQRKKPVRFIYASSAAVYGDGTLGFSDTEDLTPRLKPLNKYGFSKWMFDMWVLENGLTEVVAGLRYFNVFGPNEYHKGDMASVVFRSFPQAQREGRMRLFESHRQGISHGEQARDFVYIEEAIAMTLFVLENRSANGFFNIGTGRAHTFNDLARGVFDGLGREPVIEYFPMPEALRDRYQYFTQADMSRLHAAGYPQQKDRFHELVARYVCNYLVPGYLRLQEVSP